MYQIILYRISVIPQIIPQLNLNRHLISLIAISTIIKNPPQSPSAISLPTAQPIIPMAFIIQMITNNAIHILLATTIMQKISIIMHKIAH
jgi:hypothetical protein